MKICPTPNAESPAENMEEISRGERGDFGKDQSSPVKTSSSASSAPPRESSDIARYKNSDHTDGFNPVEFDGIRMQAGLNSFILTADERTPQLPERKKGEMKAMENRERASVGQHQGAAMKLTTPDYPAFLIEIKARIRRGQYQALRAANTELLSLYWDLGEAIHQKQEALGWGKAVVQTLSDDLQAEFPGQSGFSATNLWLMRQFFAEYQSRPKLQPLVGEISWAKNLLIMGRCKDDLQREFYLRATARFGWTKAVLQHQIDSQSYEKYLLNQTNFNQTLPPEIRNQALLAVKDEYTFDLMGLAEEHDERELETALTRNIRRFLAEMGGLFAFVGAQHRLEVGGQEYFVDLLLFHRRLRCLIAIELKARAFQPEHKGKMEFYLEALDAQERLEGENPPIGIIICREKNKTVVEYALRTASRPIGVASYTVSSELPAAYRDDLPSPEQIAERLKLWAPKEVDQ